MTVFCCFVTLNDSSKIKIKCSTLHQTRQDSVFHNPTVDFQNEGTDSLKSVIPSDDDGSPCASTTLRNSQAPALSPLGLCSRYLRSHFQDKDLYARPSLEASAIGLPHHLGREASPRSGTHSLRHLTRASGTCGRTSGFHESRPGWSR